MYGEETCGERGAKKVIDAASKESLKYLIWGQDGVSDFTVYSQVAVAQKGLWLNF